MISVKMLKEWNKHTALNRKLHFSRYSNDFFQWFKIFEKLTYIKKVSRIYFFLMDVSWWNIYISVSQLVCNYTQTCSEVCHD